MTRARRFAAAALMAAACAHPPPPRGEAPPSPVAWPAPPAAPRARLVAILPDPSAPPPERPWWKVLLGWITGGTIGGEDALTLVRPFGVAALPDGTLAVADPDASALFRLSAAGRLSQLRCDHVEWLSPMAVAVEPDQSLLVADAGLAAVVRVRGKECQVLGAGAFERPTGLAVSGGRIYVADPPRHQIIVLAPDGTVETRFGGQGSGEGQFAFPTSIAIAPDGTLLVTDALNFRVVRLAQDGRWVAAFGEPGDEGAKLSRPKGIAAAADGTIFVSDAQRDLILAFTAGGDPEYSIGAPGDGPGMLALPSGLATAPGRLYVADSQNRRIQVIELLGGTP